MDVANVLTKYANAPPLLFDNGYIKLVPNFGYPYADVNFKSVYSNGE